MITEGLKEKRAIKYLIYLAGYILTIVSLNSVLNDFVTSKLNIALFVLIAALPLVFCSYEFINENYYYESRYSWPLFSHMWFITLFTIVLTALHIYISYLQSKNLVDPYTFQSNYLLHESGLLFWFLIFSVGIVVPILQALIATAFFFNYLFTEDNVAIAIIGIITSGIVFGLLNYQFSLPLFYMQTLTGILIAWSFLKSQAIWVPLYFAIVSGLLTVVLI